MIAGSIARRWARALLAIGRENDNLVGVVREVGRLAEAWTASEELRRVMTDPVVTWRTRKEIAAEVSRKLGVSRLVANFAGLLVDKGRFAELAAIHRELVAMADEVENRVRAEVISAVPLSDDVVAQLHRLIEQATRKVVVITRREDPALLGGVVTKVGDTMFDGSIRTRLEQLKEAMVRA